nr:MAG TPA: hypothetical protein [Caudoviricetes sp.]
MQPQHNVWTLSKTCDIIQAKEGAFAPAPYGCAIH